MLTARALRPGPAFDSATQAKRNIVRALEAVAHQLGNTPAICRKSYVHPAVIDAYLDGGVLPSGRRRAERRGSELVSGVRPEEAAVLGLLRRCLARAVEPAVRRAA